MLGSLLELYRQLLSRANQLPPQLRERLGCPFFPFPRDRWQQARHRILLVGQEPFEWGFNSGEHYPWPHPDLWTLPEALGYPRSVDALTWAYKIHTYEIPSPYHPTPFTRAFDHFISRADHDNSVDVVSTNIFRCVLRIDEQPDSRSSLNGSDDDLRRILDWQRGCLTEEISTINPTAVVFFTGPRYDDVLRDEFKDIQFVAVDNRPAREFARVSHERLPKCSVRTYHPGYLVRTRERRFWIDKIAAMATETQNK